MHEFGIKIVAYVNSGYPFVLDMPGCGFAKSPKHCAEVVGIAGWDGVEIAYTEDPVDSMQLSPNSGESWVYALNKPLYLN